MISGKTIDTMACQGLGWSYDDDQEGMMATPQQLAHEERARAETKSYKDARAKLSRLKLGSVDISRLLAAAKRKGSQVVTVNGVCYRASYRNGTYTVTR